MKNKFCQITIICGLHVSGIWCLFLLLKPFIAKDAARYPLRETESLKKLITSWQQQSVEVRNDTHCQWYCNIWKWWHMVTVWNSISKCNMTHSGRCQFQVFWTFILYEEYFEKYSSCHNMFWYVYTVFEEIWQLGNLVFVYKTAKNLSTCSCPVNSIFRKADIRELLHPYNLQSSKTVLTVNRKIQLHYVLWGEEEEVYNM